MTMKTKPFYTFLFFLVLAAVPLHADWQRTPASDVDKEFISGNEGLVIGEPPDDMSCWLAAASNMLAAAGYSSSGGTGNTIQERADEIYFDMITWQAATTLLNEHGVKYGGWMDNALNWWLGSSNNGQAGTNPYTVISTYGNTNCNPWGNTDGPRFLGNELRDYQSVSIGIRWPKSGSGCTGGHAITPWGDDGFSSDLWSNPGQIIVADSDRDGGGPFQTYTYDSFTNPNPSGSNEGNGWYFNFSDNHTYIVQVVTLCPTDNPVDPGDGPTQKVVGSYKIHQNDLEWATDLHYTAWTDYDILGYRTKIDWPTVNEAVITESDTHVPSLIRSDIHVDWDLSDNPVPYCTDVTITTEFILQDWNGIWYDDVYFTYPGEEDTKFLQPPFVHTNGTDIRVDNKDSIERLLADDFRCATPGEITKVHLWGSWDKDDGKNEPSGKVEKFHLSIYSDDPVGDNPIDPNDDPNNEYSRPLQLLWSRSFDEFMELDYSLVDNEYFWDPYTAAPLSWDDRIWYYIIEIPEADAFIQEGTRTDPKTYWLGVAAEISGENDPQFGWKTTAQGWNDAAVMYTDVYTLTDEFDYWEDQITHSYVSSGSCSLGSIGCDTNSLSIGNCDFDSSARITVSVVPDTDTVKLRYRIPWSGFEGSGPPSGATLYVDGVNQGSMVSSPFSACVWQEKILAGMSADTADGLLDIKIVDEINGCDGDIQITYLEVYSMEKGWVPLSYPIGHRLVGTKVDMSFGIVTPTTEPGPLLPEFGWHILSSELADSNIPDITGGYVVGGFDVFDMAGEPNLQGQYRLIHQYPYTQDPEKHIFTIQGPNDQTNCEYVATNFRFGHSYGMLDSRSLWQFSEWMTKSEAAAYLCSRQPLTLTLDWQGRLPYPPSNITPADEIPPALECTVYFIEDLNKDCFVDFKDVAMLAARWLQSTAL